MAPFPVAHQIFYLLAGSDRFDNSSYSLCVGKKIIQIVVHSQADNAGSELQIRSTERAVAVSSSRGRSIVRSESWLAQHQD